MKAATRIRMGSVGSVLVVLLLVAVLAGGFASLKAAVELNDRIARSLNGVFELSVLTTDFVLHLEPRAESQWQAKYGALRSELAEIPAGVSGGADSNIEVLLLSYGRVGGMFERIVEAREALEAGDIDPEVSRVYRERLAAQMLIEMQKVVTALTILGEDTSGAVLRTMLTLLMVASGIAAAAVVLTSGNAWITERDVARRLINLRTVAIRLGEGDLSQRTGIAGGADEVSELVRAFDEMADRIEGAYVMLNQEVGQRRQAEAELSAYRDHLETLVEERTTELEESNLALRAATVAKDRFLAAMSHELRTPLNSIIGFSDIMLRGMAGDLSDEQRKQLVMVNASGKHLLALISDMLDLSRIEAGADDVVVETVAIETLAGGCIEMVRPGALEKHVQIELRISDGAPATIETDMRKIRQILINLLSNAVKFTDAGEIVVTVSPGEGGMVEISVADTGIGIAPDMAERIFDTFFQGPDPRVAKVSGTGLGLAISRRLAHMLGSTLKAENRETGGAVFTLAVPVVPPSG